MRQLTVACAFGIVLAGASAAMAQGTAAKPATPPATESRPTTTTASGDTGLWFVPTAEVLLHKRWSVSFYQVNRDDGQGFTDINFFPLTVGVGLGNRAEIFGSWTIVTRVDRDARPLFFSSTAAESSTGTGGGILPDYPFIRGPWSGNARGDAWIGGKVNLLASRTDPLAVAVRAQAKLPVGDDTIGVSTGKADFQVDGIVSTHTSMVEVSGFGGMIIRGNPSGYTLTNGVRWGAGAAFPNIMHSGLRVTTELVGEHYIDNSISAPAGLFGDDGSPVPTVTFLKDPLLLNLGLTWQASNGFFIGGGAVWNLSMKGRSDATGLSLSSFPDVSGDKGGVQVRIGYSPGTKNRNPPPPPPLPPTPPPPPPPPPPAPVNHPPVVQASCDPCRIEVGRTAIVSADARDPDGDALTYQWTTAAGALATATSRQSQWTAPQQVGRVNFTVTVTDSKGLTASSTTAIDVVAPPRREYTFEDVHFDFDRFTLRPDALHILDDAVTAMQADSSLKLQIEGHTCNIGTTEYNMALGERRAQAVREYLTSRGIDASRMTTVSYGEERPKYDNDREETRRMNRRAALVVRLQ